MITPGQFDKSGNLISGSTGYTISDGSWYASLADATKADGSPLSVASSIPPAVVNSLAALTNSAQETSTNPVIAGYVPASAPKLSFFQQALKSSGLNGYGAPIIFGVAAVILFLFLRKFKTK